MPRWEIRQAEEISYKIRMPSDKRQKYIGKVGVFVVKAPEAVVRKNNEKGKNSRGICPMRTVKGYRENRALIGFALHIYGALHGLYLCFHKVQPQSPAF